MHRLAFFILLLPLAAACGKVDDTPVTPGSAQFWIKSSVPATGSTSVPSFTVEALFLPPGESSCATTTIGACTIDPCFVPTSSAAGRDISNAGQITAVTSATTAAIEPASDGTYAQQRFVGAPWMAGGDSITLAWAHFPGSATQAGGTQALDTPTYVTLSAGSPFADPTSTIARTDDLTFSWTSDAPPASTDEVGVYLRSGSTDVGCNFDTSSGTGVVPVAALQKLGAGAGSFDIHSKALHHSENLFAADGSTWAFHFNVDAAARTSYGLASGPVTFQ